MSRIVIGIAGGSGSGKTTVADLITKDLGEDRVALLSQDSYYKDLSNLPMSERRKANFDHPSMIDFALMANHIRDLKNGIKVEVPLYNFATYSRLAGTVPVTPRDILLVEGILILAIEEIRDLLNIKIYVDTDDDLRLIRRIRRDIQERGRSLDSIIEQYLATVRPMHLEFVEKSRRYADIILPWRDFNSTAVSMVTNMLRGFIDL